MKKFILPVIAAVLCCSTATPVTLSMATKTATATSQQPMSPQFTTSC